MNGMDVIIERPAALDVHNASVMACVRVPGTGGRREEHVTQFTTTAAGLVTLRDWLEAHEVTQVAMEATGVYCVSVRYTERLDEIGAVAYDNALAETTVGLYKAELIHPRGPWTGVNDLSIATLKYVDWFNHRRLHGAIGMIPPAEYEATYYRSLAATTAAGQNQ